MIAKPTQCLFENKVIDVNCFKILTRHSRFRGNDEYSLGKYRVFLSLLDL